jgi:AraC-like DNA-binding protein
MRPLLSKSGQALFDNTMAVRRVNRWLLAAAAQSRPVLAGTLSCRLAHIHIGRGLLPCGFHTGLHVHGDAQLEHVLFGKVRLVMSDDTSYTLKAGDLAFLPPGLAHGLDVLEPAGVLGALVEVEGEGAEAFHAHCLRRCLSGEKDLSPMATAWADQMLMTSMEDELNEWSLETVADLLRLWLRASLQPHLRTLPMVDGNLQDTPGAEAHNRHETQRDRALAFIRANVGRPIRAEDVAHDLAVSTRHLNRLFRSALSETVSESITRHRLTFARRLLAEDPRLQIKQVAAAVGYDSAAYFSYCFRRQFGYSPSHVPRTEAADGL